MNINVDTELLSNYKAEVFISDKDSLDKLLILDSYKISSTH